MNHLIRVYFQVMLRIINDKLSGKGYYEAKFAGQVVTNGRTGIGVLRRAEAYRMQVRKLECWDMFY